MTLNKKRQLKYPNTDTFQYYNRNPKGKITTVCVIRALSTALDLPYNQVVMDIATLQCETGLDDASKEMIELYLKKNGWVKCKQPRKSNNTKYTGDEFCKMLKQPKCEYKLGLPYCDTHNIVANIGGHHIVAIKDFKVHDIWNSTYGCIGNVWVKPNCN